MMGETLQRWRGAHPGIALFVFGVACAMTFSEVSAQVATFTTQRYPLLGNTHIAADLNKDGRPDLAGAGANAVSVMLGNGDGTEDIGGSSTGRLIHRTSPSGAILAVKLRVR